MKNKLLIVLNLFKKINIQHLLVVSLFMLLSIPLFALNHNYALYYLVSKISFLFLVIVVIVEAMKNFIK